jgi:flagellar assembly protein FliH
VATTEEFAFPALEGAVVAAGPSAEARAAQIVAHARSEAAAVARAAQDEGHARGLAAGLDEARAELAPAAEALAEALRGVAGAQDALAASLERRAVELAVAIAEKILGAALELDPGRVANVIVGALRRSASRDRIVLEVNPADVDAVNAVIGDLSRSVGVGELDVRPERRIARGGCVVRTEDGDVDAQVAAQLDRAREVLLDSAGTA